MPYPAALPVKSVTFGLAVTMESGAPLSNTLDCSAFGYAPATSGWTEPRFGYPGFGTGLSTGALDEVSIFQRLLSAGEIADDDAAGI